MAQDESHIPTRDRSLTAVWLALDDATVDNGCLWVIPGSHRRGVLYPARDWADPRFDGTPEAHGFPHDADEAVPVELPAGAALIFDGYLLHRSLGRCHAATAAAGAAPAHAERRTTSSVSRVMPLGEASPSS